MRGATNVLQLLNTENPQINYEAPANFGNTKKLDYAIPKRLRKWDEFNLTTLEAIFGGSLIAAASKRRDSLPGAPYLSSQTDKTVRCELTTRHVLMGWSHKIIQPALDVMEESFNACAWYPSPGKVDHLRYNPKIVDAGAEDPPSPASTSRSLSRKPRRALIPDGGTLLTCPKHGTQCPSSSVERMPKEYKTARKWTTSDLEEILDNEKFIKCSTKTRAAWPVRQAFTYCVHHLCHYGCILTTKEAFIFRIRPMGSDVREDMKTRLESNGLMEYVSVPWDGKQNDLNLIIALWFVHILAGNHHKVAGEYGRLGDETLS